MKQLYSLRLLNSEAHYVDPACHLQKERKRIFFFLNTERFILQCVVDLVSIIRQRKSKKGVNVITLEGTMCLKDLCDER